MLKSHLVVVVHLPRALSDSVDAEGAVHVAAGRDARRHKCHGLRLVRRRQGRCIRRGIGGLREEHAELVLVRVAKEDVRNCLGREVSDNVVEERRRVVKTVATFLACQPHSQQGRLCRLTCRPSR